MANAWILLVLLTSFAAALPTDTAGPGATGKLVPNPSKEGDTVKYVCKFDSRAVACEPDFIEFVRFHGWEIDRLTNFSRLLVNDTRLNVSLDRSKEPWSYNLSMACINRFNNSMSFGCGARWPCLGEELTIISPMNVTFQKQDALPICNSTAPYDDIAEGRWRDDTKFWGEGGRGGPDFIIRHKTMKRPPVNISVHERPENN